MKDSTPESEIRCIILKSKNPGMFCAGADLKERLNLTNNEVESVVNNLRTTFDCFYVKLEIINLTTLIIKIRIYLFLQLHVLMDQHLVED